MAFPRDCANFIKDDAAYAIRAAVALLMAWGIAFITGKFDASRSLEPDNAKYQKCKEISEYIAILPSIKLFYLLPYSPSLNLIERFWICEVRDAEWRIYRHLIRVQAENRQISI
ncbi:MAG: transposase [Clostridiales bacterium]|jgi:transposase|nr:transposase [Clostridiales bacterium]